MTASVFFQKPARRAALAFFAFAVFAVAFGAPRDHPTGAKITLPEGATLAEAAGLLANARAVRFPAVFSLAVRLGGGRVFAGSYAVKPGENALSLAYRFSRGDFGLPRVKVTIPEGASAREAAAILSRALGDFDARAFTRLASPDEGRLFPDTYFFFPGEAPASVAAAMRANFARRIAPLGSRLAAFGHPEADVLTMASLLEKEARQKETRRVIAGILWKRIARGMPLQVDATFGYMFATSTFSPSAANKKIDSPYNTYLHRGLPPGPIGNPGLEAIEDAVTPTATPYLYYVTDAEGNIYYAKTLDEHIQNIRKAARAGSTPH